MIVPMKKVVLLAVASEQTDALAALRNLGVMQIEPGKKSSPGTAELQETLAESRRALQAIEKAAGDSAPPVASGKNKSCGSGAEVLEMAAKLSGCQEKLTGESDALEQRLRRLAVWGEFDRSLIAKLEAAGVNVYLCVANNALYEEARQLEGFECRLISSESKLRRFVLAGMGSVDPEKFGAVRLAEDDDPATLRSRQQKNRERNDKISAELRKLAKRLPAARHRISELESELEFRRAEDALGNAEAVVYLRGYVPAPEIEKLRAEAAAHGWGLLITDPKSDDTVPVLIRESRFTRIVKPLFDFLGVLPGYREMDVSGGVLIFFTIFYAMIIGDAGYGLLFLSAAIVADFKFRSKPAAKMPIRLFMLLSVATIIWGALCGNYFGMAHIPWTDKPFPGLKWLTDPATKNTTIQTFCFFLALAQLGSGRIWRAIHDGNMRAFVRNLGWTLILAGNFILTLRIIVWPGDFPVYMYYLYGVGLAMVLLCDVDWKDPAAIFQFPFSIIGSFTDVLSYIRLFAVGMAGSCIAASFNSMGMDVAKASPWFIIFGVATILCGHLLNIALGIMGVLVHGVRLNTLEFSNHTGLSWSGQKFKPFTHSNSEEK